MGLSYDIISEFVKVTNGNKEKPKEGIVYATIVQASDGKYVKIDGSDLLTPTDTTTDIEDGERVTVMIKDHRATVTGNVTAPSASGNRVDRVVDTVTEQIGVFETVVADKISVNELEAYKIIVEELIAGKATIEDLEVVNATIENLRVKDAEIENAVIDKADIEDLEAVNAVIENLRAKDAEIENLVADKATINDLNAVNADIQNLRVKHAQIEDLVADKADIEDLEATNAEIENLKATDVRIENLVADRATIRDLEATKAEIEVLDADFAEIKTLVNGNLTSDNISSFNITADKVTMEDAFIKDAMIDTVNAAKINAGRINTNSVVIGSEDGGMRISGATQQFTDKNGNVRIQIGRDASDDFTFALYGEDGQGQLINQNGITASAISDGLIVNDMISDNASISGGKLDISSVVTEINNDNTTTIKSNKIYLDEQNQSLEVAFESLKTQVDIIKDMDIDGELTTITDKIQSNTAKIEANKTSIQTLISEDAAIKEQVTDLEGNVVETTNTLTSKYTSLQQNLDGFKTTVNNTYATKTSVNDVENNLSSNYSTTSAMNSAIEQKVDEISASVSSTYATKNEVKTIDDNIKANYSTTEQMESAISVAKNEINLGISQVYETKTEVSNKIGDAVNNIEIGARNYLLNTAKSVTVTGDNRTNQTNYFYSLVDNDPRPFRNKKITFSAEYELSSDAVGTFRFQTDGKSNNDLGIASGYWVSLSDNINVTSSSNRTGQIIYTRIMTDTDSTGYTGIGLRLDNFTGEITINNAKFEIGDKNTSWTPAVEDIDANISSAITTSKDYTDSQIRISKDAIELGVSQTYETKSSVTSQINNTLTSARSYADTKKSEAISTASSDATSKANNALNSAKSYADTKKSEAITSANNTLNTTIANYYTKAQTDSQINIAKDAITSSVSSTYETKTNVQNKIDAIQVGGRNLAIGSKTATNDFASGGGTVTTASDLFGGVTAVKTNTAWSGRYFNLKAIAQRGGFKVGDKLVLSVYIKSDQNVTLNITAHRTMGTGNTAGSSKAYNNFTVTPTWKQVWFPFVADAGTLDRVDARIEVNTATNTNYIYWAGWKLEKGTVGTDWSPAPEDVDNNISSLTSRVSSAEQKITDSAIVSTVTSSTTYINNLTGKVDKATIISSINQTAESVKINASKIELTGSVVVNAINGGSTLINGSKIQTGTISANSITSGTFQGTNFIAGGSSNGNGYFQVKDSSNDVKFHASKNGIYATSMTFPNTISVSGAITQSGNVYANSNGFNVNGEETGTLYRTVYTSQVGLSGITTTEQSYNTSNGGNVAGTKYTTKITGYAVNINGSSLRHGGSGSLEVGTSYGYVRLGPADSDWCHFNTDRSKFWFEKPVYVSGEIYAGSGYNKRVYHQGYKPTPADIGAAKALVSANGYQGLALNDGSTSDWIRTTVNGLIPYQSGGHGNLGTSSWPFQNLYANKGYINEVKSISSSASLGLTGQANVWITSGTGSTGSIFIQSPTMKPASGNTTNLGDNTYKWKAVYSNNGTIQTSDERFKVKQGFVDVDECYAMIKDINIYNYIMLSKNKDELSKSRLGKLAMSCKDDDVNIHIGVMAQDIQKYNCSKGIIIKNVYQKDDGTTDTQLSINPYSLTTAVMGGLQKEISIRDEQYEQLKRENEELKLRLSRLEQSLIQTN